MSKWAKIAMNPNGKEGSYQRFLNWLTNESEGAERFDAILGSMAIDPKNTTLKSSPCYYDFLLYQDRCTSLDLPVKFRPLLLIVAEHMRVDESKANFTSSRMIFECKLPGHEPEQVRAFQTQVHLLLNSMKKLPDPSEIFEWYFMQFEKWPPLADVIKIFKRAKPGHVIRTIGYLWVQVEEELALHYAEKNQQGWMQEVQRMPVIQMRTKPKQSPAMEKKKKAKLAAAKKKVSEKSETDPKTDPKKKAKKKKKDETAGDAPASPAPPLDSDAKATIAALRSDLNKYTQQAETARSKLEGTVGARNLRRNSVIILVRVPTVHMETHVTLVTITQMIPRKIHCRITQRPVLVLTGLRPSRPRRPRPRQRQILRRRAPK